MKIEPYWTMPWSKYGEDKEDEIIFEPEHALAQLLVDEQVFLNSYWWKRWQKPWEDKTILVDNAWSEDDAKLVSVNVNCNDVFAWGCADSEPLPFSKLQNLYDHYVKDKMWGTAVWCIKQRKMKPQKPVENAIKERGIWDLGSIYEEMDRSKG